MSLRLKPLCKWAGGKRWLVERYAHLLPETAAYREPFVGGGAVAAHYLSSPRRPAHVVLSDSNARLIATYRGVRDDPDGVIRHLRSLTYDRARYAATRKLFNYPHGVALPHEVAAQFIYLNRCGFNGLYRENRSGEFNVPFGKYANPTICDEPLIREWSRALQGVVLHVSRFDDVLAIVRPEEFVFLDPPYVPASDTSNFTAYTAAGFGPADQARLVDLLRQLDAKGVHWILTNAAAARDLYTAPSSGRTWHVMDVEVSRGINSDAAKRGAVGEIIVSNRPLVERSEAV